MNFSRLFRTYGIIISLMLITISGVQAISISTVDVNINPDGSGTVDMQYQMNGTEKLQYALVSSVLDISAIGQKELEKSLGKPVSVTSVNTESASFVIRDLVTQKDGEYVIPSIRYMPVESVLDPNLLWVLKKININFIPGETTVTFPDGYQEKFKEEQVIPSIRHKEAQNPQ